MIDVLECYVSSLIGVSHIDQFFKRIQYFLGTAIVLLGFQGELGDTLEGEGWS